VTSQGYLAHEKISTLLGPPKDPRRKPTVGSQGAAIFDERGSPVGYQYHFSIKWRGLGGRERLNHYLRDIPILGPEKCCILQWETNEVGSTLRCPPSQRVVQESFPHQEKANPEDPIVWLCLRPCGGPGGQAVSYERGTPVRKSSQDHCITASLEVRSPFWGGGSSVSPASLTLNPHAYVTLNPQTCSIRYIIENLRGSYWEQLSLSLSPHSTKCASFKTRICWGSL
jgi:hypothetical protein